MIIATGFYSGYVPKAPGTCGSLVALPVHFLLIKLPVPYYFSALGIIFVIAVITAGGAEKIIDRPDPGVIVIDEIIGMLITLIYSPANILVWFLGFFIFRFFDIFKPFPVCWFDQKIHGGTGIVMDDVMAGIYSLICLQLICHFAGW
jgi:phosphatidylglycerophosphatase A